MKEELKYWQDRFVNAVDDDARIYAIEQMRSLAAKDRGLFSECMLDLARESVARMDRVIAEIKMSGELAGV
jgi:hypothetical protein